MDATHHAELRNLLSRALAQAGCDPELIADLLDFTLSMTRHGCATFLEFLEYALPVLSPPPPPPIPMEEWHRLNEQALLDFDARMQQVIPTYEPGDRVKLHGDVFEIHRYQRGDGMTGYWLRRGKAEVFISIVSEALLQPVVH
jgi:hypothetical protein